MRRLALILLAVFAVQTVDVSDADARRRRRKPSCVGVVVAATGNVIEDYTWAQSWWSSDAENLNWIEHGGNSGGDRLIVTPNPGLDLSTTGLTDAGLPSALIDKAATPNSTPVGWKNGADTTPFDITQDTAVHWRTIFKVNTALVNGKYIFAIRDGSLETYEARIFGTTGVIKLWMRNTAEALVITTGNDIAADVWVLLDMRLVPSTGVILASVSGKHYTLTAAATPHNIVLEGALVQLGILANALGGSPADADVVFLGFRYGTITNAEHETDLASLGITDIDP